MNATTPSLEPQSVGARSLFFRRWHFSSRLVVVLTVLLLVVVNLPGNVARHVDEVHAAGNFQLLPQYEHGWPLIHTVRQERTIGWTHTFSIPTIKKCWQFWDLGKQDEFHAGPLAGNIAIGLAIIMLTGCLFEIWRRRHRSLLQIHLLDVGMTITAVAVVLGWYVAARTAHEREEALVSIQVDEMTEHGRIGYEMFSVEREQRGPTWLRLWLGDKYFQFLDRVVAAESHGEEGGRRLVEFRELRKTGLAHRDLTDLAQLRQMPQLEELDLALRIRTEPANRREIQLPLLRNLRILTIRSIENRATGLDQMQNLRVLNVHDSFLSSETLQEISQLRNLRRLSLTYSYFPVESLQRLRSLSRLEDLDLDQTTLNNDLLAWLPDLPALRRLSLQQSNFSEASLGSIARCKSLESLYLDHLTEAGLRTLSDSPQLKYIEVTTPDRQALSWPKKIYGWRINGSLGDGIWIFYREPRTTNAAADGE